MANQRPPHLIVIGGFLGAGKTTAIRALAARLTEQGIRVGLITNDQGTDLVDSELLRRCGFATSEVTGGCFCCRFDDLLGAADLLSSDMAPEVFIAEAVGSCTDLSATVTRPLRALYGDRFSVAPLSVLIDPQRARSLLGVGGDLEGGERFDADVAYIYRKQIEEGEILVMTKCDLHADDSINELGAFLADRHRGAEVMAISSADGLNVDDWLHRLLYGADTTPRRVDIDYDVYASGEARLGWLNATIRVLSQVAFDPNVVLYDVAWALQCALVAARVPVAHLKMTMTSGEMPTAIASINVVGNSAHPVPGMSIPASVREAIIVLNLRAESDPERLAAIVRTLAVGAMSSATPATMAVMQLDAFRPGRPEPTHRLT